MIYEYTCRQCGTPNEHSTSPTRPEPPEACCACGSSDLRRKWNASVVWPKDQRGH